jgi:hypothetical protein
VPLLETDSHVENLWDVLRDLSKDSITLEIAIKNTEDLERAMGIEPVLPAWEPERFRPTFMPPANAGLAVS